MQSISNIHRITKFCKMIILTMNIIFDVTHSKFNENENKLKMK